MMETKTLFVTGESLFLDRHQFLFKALSNHFEKLRFSHRQSEWYEAKLPRIALKGLLTLRTGSLSKANKVRRVVPKAKLTIIGKKLPIEEVGVENLGHVASRLDIRDLFLKADLVVAPAYCDPFPTFLMEAMNYGVPCIVSDRDGMPEIVDRSVNGIVLNQLTDELLASHMIHLLMNPSVLASMSKAARLKIGTKLNWNTIAKTIVQTIAS